MISRVADHCFWLGRYLERAESTARVLSVTDALALDAGIEPSRVWPPVVTVTGEGPTFRARFGDAAAGDGERVQRYLALDLDNPTSLRRSVGAARENARSIREIVSLEVWQTLNELYLWLASDAAAAEWDEHRHGYYRRVRDTVQLTLGVARSTMLHEPPLDFIWLGMLLERTGQTARLLDVHHHVLGPTPDARVETSTALWQGLLRACSGFEPFMKRTQGRVGGREVAAFVAFEAAFPRSLRYTIRSARARLASILEGAGADAPGTASLAALAELCAFIDVDAPDRLVGPELHATLTRVIDATAAICEGVGRELLGYAPSEVAAQVSQ